MLAEVLKWIALSVRSRLLPLAPMIAGVLSARETICLLNWESRICIAMGKSAVKKTQATRISDLNL